MEANSSNSAMLLALAARLDALSQRLTDPTDKATVAEASNAVGRLWPLTCPHCKRLILEP